MGRLLCIDLMRAMGTHCHIPPAWPIPK